MNVAHIYLWKNRSKATYTPILPDASDPQWWNNVVFQLLLAKTDRAYIEYWPDPVADAEPQTEAQLLAFLKFLETQTIHPNLRVAVYIPMLRTPTNQTPAKVRDYLRRLTVARPELGGRSIIQHPKYWHERRSWGLNRAPVVGWFLGAQRGHPACTAIVDGGNLTNRRWCHDIQVPADGNTAPYNTTVWNFHSFEPDHGIDSYCTGDVWPPGDVMASAGFWHIRDDVPRLQRSIDRFRADLRTARALNPRIIRWGLNERPEGWGLEHAHEWGDVYLLAVAG